MAKIQFNKGGNVENIKTFEIPHQIYKLDRLVQPGEQRVKLEWEYIGDGPDIVFTKPGCGCTAEVEYVDNKIIAYFNELAVTENGNNITQSNKEEGFKWVKKSLTVYLDDGSELYKTIGFQKNYNSNKAQLSIQFHLKVDVSKFNKDPSVKKKF